jgi:lysophospholipase L1-like esterase
MRPWLRRALFSAALLPVGLGLVNLLALGGERLAYGTVIVNGQPAGLYERVEGGGGLRRGSFNRLRPGAHLDGLLYEVRIGPLGLREPTPASPRPPGALRVWCLGGSTTFDIYAPTDLEAWPARVGALLQARFPDRVVEPINAGIPGEVLQGNADDLQRLAPTVRPDVVVIYGGPNDLREIASTARRPSPPPQGPRLMGPEQQPALVRLLMRLRPQLASDALAAQAWRLPPDQIARAARQVEAVAALARRLGARPVLATHALRAPPGATGEAARRGVAETAALLQLSPEAAIEAFDAYNAQVRAIAAAGGHPLADVRSAVGPEAAHWGDATHFRPAGSAKAAEEVARAVAQALGG